MLSATDIVSDALFLCFSTFEEYCFRFPAAYHHIPVQKVDVILMGGANET